MERRYFIFCLFFSLPKSVLIAKKLIFPQVESVLPMMAEGKLSPHLYLNHKLFYLIFPPVLLRRQSESVAG